jgi:hypothetical protein
MYIGSLCEGSLQKDSNIMDFEHKIPLREIYPDWE